MNVDRRDLFAANALSALINSEEIYAPDDVDKLCVEAWLFAERMIENDPGEREEG